MRLSFLVATVCIALVGTRVAVAQSPVVEHLTQAQLVEKALALTAKAQAGGGSASTKLSEYPNHFTMMSLRHSDGGAEIHENFADFFFVVKGRATLVSGGKVPEAKTAGAGEMRGTSVQDGTRETLNEGDIVHIPAGVPHQLLVPKNGTFAYFVIKVKEK